MSFAAKLLLFFVLSLITLVVFSNMLSHLLPAFPVLAIVTSTSAQAPKVSGSSSATVDISWYPPAQTWINDISTANHTTGTHGFIFNSSCPTGDQPYGTYNWCNMPHTRAQEYPIPPQGFKIQYVEVIHRHHKRTPYASNTFPVETSPWDCRDSALFYYGAPFPLDDHSNRSASTFWSVYESDLNPFNSQAGGFPGNCEYPQITRGGLDDSWQHGRDLYGVYHDLLHLIPDGAITPLTQLESSAAANGDAAFPGSSVSFRVTNNVITSQVAGMVISGMFNASSPATVPLLIQPSAIDSLEPTYSCPAATSLYSSYGVGSTAANWTAHITASRALFAQLDAISGVDPLDAGWHQSWDHYFDNLSARLCHEKALPCKSTNPVGAGAGVGAEACVTQDQADEVFRLGEFEYSYTYRDSPQSLQASAASYGVWIAELAQHLRDAAYGRAGESGNGNADDWEEWVAYRHNVAHDGSLSRLLSVLQLDVMVWPGMGAEVVFELYTGSAGHDDAKTGGTERREAAIAGGIQDWYVRILWSGQPLSSSSPTLQAKDGMVPLETLLAYFDGLVGERASLVRQNCGL